MVYHWFYTLILFDSYVCVFVNSPFVLFVITSIWDNDVRIEVPKINTLSRNFLQFMIF